jgi:tetratricopeptide (TPR) repeat protein
MPVYQFTLAVIADHAGRSDIAAPAYQAAAEADDLPTSWLGVAAAHTANGDTVAARAALQEALRIGNQQTAVLAAGADLYLRMGDEASAIDALSQVVAMSPTLAEDPAWNADPRLRAVRDRVMDAARRRLSGTSAVQLALSAGDMDAAREMLDTLAPPDRSLMTLVVRGWAGDRAAATELKDLAAAHPLDILLLRQAARVASEQRDHRSAMELRTWLETVVGMSSVESYDVRFAADDIDPPRVAGLLSAFHGAHVYRRPTPADQIPRGLLQLTLQ